MPKGPRQDERDHYEKRKQLQVTIDGNANKRKNPSAQVNLAVTATEENDGEDIIQC